MSTVQYCCPIAIKSLVSQQILMSLLYQISQKSIQWEPNCDMRTDGRTDTHDRGNRGRSPARAGA